ncbi:MAG: biotin--[acetyl-CoA-carboxylase] ligase [Trueperaceae bacterium]|nr:MAG: biotin--[acetyl-CoA-carboxylase] ligase [Trueperaceae bacterium]
MRRKLASGEDVHGLVIRAHVQTQGRGRQGKVWSSPAGGSYQTIGLRDSGTSRLRMPLVGLAIGAGLATTFKQAGAQVGLKWPNDLYYKGKKIGGILTEYLQQHLLVGIGLNVSNRPPEGGASLTGWELGEVGEIVLEGYRLGLGMFYSGEDITALWSEYDVLAGQPVVIRYDSGVIRGTARGICNDGRLKVEGAGGEYYAVGVGRLLSYNLKVG